MPFKRCSLYSICGIIEYVFEFEFWYNLKWIMLMLLHFFHLKTMRIMIYQIQNLAQTEDQQILKASFIDVHKTLVSSYKLFCRWAKDYSKMSWHNSTKTLIKRTYNKYVVDTLSPLDQTSLDKQTTKILRICDLIIAWWPHLVLQLCMFDVNTPRK